MSSKSSQIHVYLEILDRFPTCREVYRYYMVCHEILWPVLCKKWGFSCKPHLFLFFIVAQFHVKTGWNWWYFFCFIWLKKWNWLMVSWVKTGIKLWNRPEVGREKNETDGTRCRWKKKKKLFDLDQKMIKKFLIRIKKWWKNF